MDNALTTERIRVWRPEELEGVEVVHTENQTRPDVYYFDHFAFASPLRDHAEARYRRWSYTVEGRTVQMCEPGQLYVTRAQHVPCASRLLFVDPPVVEGAARELSVRGVPHWSRPITRDPLLFGALNSLHQAVDNGSSPLSKQTLLAEALRLLLERHGEEPPRRSGLHKPAVVRAREYLHAHFSESISLDNLACAAHLSKYELVRQFRDQMGLPPHQYLIRVRLAAAKRLLASGASISRAALESGFSAQSHLHRHFVRSLGVTPGRYRSASVAKT